MSSNRLLVATLSTVMILATSAIPSEAHLRRPPLERLQSQLLLSDDQVRAIHEAHERHWEPRRQLAGALGAARRSLRELVWKGADEGAVKAKTAEVQQLLAQVVELRVKTLLEVSQILTPEQREKLLQLRPGGRPGAPPLG